MVLYRLLQASSHRSALAGVFGLSLLNLFAEGCSALYCEGQPLLSFRAWKFAEFLQQQQK